MQLVETLREIFIVVLIIFLQFCLTARPTYRERLQAYFNF